MKLCLLRKVTVIIRKALKENKDDETVSLASYIYRKEDCNMLNFDQKSNKAAESEKRESYTSHHIHLDGWKIYIDKDQRENVIPRSASLVDEFYRLLDMENLPYNILKESEDPEKYDPWFYHNIGFSTFKLNTDSDCTYQDMQEVIVYYRSKYYKNQASCSKISIEEIRVRNNLYK